MMESSITEPEVFKIVIEEDQKSNENTDFAKLVDVMGSNYNVKLRAVEKELLRPCPKHYNAKKKLGPAC